MPFFDGGAIFGGAVEVDGPHLRARRQQRNAYPGLNGIESIDMGDEGMESSVSGRLAGATPLDLTAALNVIRSYVDGNAYVFVDHTGYTWTNVLMIEVTTAGRGQLDPELGYTQRYTARLFHLTVG
jgi:phage tail tube protein FII